MPLFELRKLQEQILNGEQDAFDRLVERVQKPNTTAAKELTMLMDIGIHTQGERRDQALNALLQIAKIPHNTGCKNEYRLFTKAIDYMGVIGSNTAADNLESLYKGDIYKELTCGQKEQLEARLIELGEDPDITNITALELAALDDRKQGPQIVKRLTDNFGTEREEQAITAIINIGAKSERVFLAPLSAFVPSIMPESSGIETKTLRPEALKTLITEYIRHTEGDELAQGVTYGSYIANDLECLDTPEALRTLADIATLDPAQFDEDTQRTALGFFTTAATRKLKELMQIAVEHKDTGQIENIASYLMQVYQPATDTPLDLKSFHKNKANLQDVLKSRAFVKKLSGGELPVQAEQFYSDTAKTLLGELTRPEALNHYLENSADRDGTELRNLFEDAMTSGLVDPETICAVKETFNAVTQSRTQWQRAHNHHGFTFGTPEAP